MALQDLQNLLQEANRQQNTRSVLRSREELGLPSPTKTPLQKAGVETPPTLTHGEELAKRSTEQIGEANKLFGEGKFFSGSAEAIKGGLSGIGAAFQGTAEGVSDLTKKGAAKLGIMLSGTDLTDEQKQKVYYDLTSSPEFKEKSQSDADIINLLSSALVPLGAAGATAKGVGTLGKIAKGAGVGVAGMGAQTIQTEGKLPTPTEAGIGAVLGGVGVTGAGQRMIGSGLAGAGVGAGVGASVGSVEGGKEGAIEGAKKGALIGAGVGAAGSLAKTAIKAALPAEKLINTLIKPLQKDFSYGKNPGRAVSEEGITANSLDELGSKIGERRQQVGEEIGAKLEKNTSKVDIADAVKPIDEAIAQAGKTPRTNATLIQRLQDAKKDILGIVEDENGKVISKRKLTGVNLIDALDVKKMVGEITKFTGNASDDKLVNIALKRVYGNIKGKINQAAPDVVPLNEKYADLTSAEIATKYRDKIEARQDLVSFGTKSAGVTGALLAAVATGDATNLKTIAAGLGSAGLAAALGSTAIKTRLAKALAGKSSQELSILFKDVPDVWKSIQKLIPSVKNTKGSATLDVLTTGAVVGGGTLGIGALASGTMSEKTKKSIREEVIRKDMIKKLNNK